MPVRGGNKVRRNMRQTLRQISNDLTPTVVKEILIIGEGYAANLTPVDTSNLINSGFRTVTNTATGAVGVAIPLTTRSTSMRRAASWMASLGPLLKASAQAMGARPLPQIKAISKTMLNPAF